MILASKNSGYSEFFSRNLKQPKCSQICNKTFFGDNLILNLEHYFQNSKCGGLPSSLSGSAPANLYLTLQTMAGYQLIHKIASSGIQSCDLSLCFYLNLKHDNLDRSATTASRNKTIFSKYHLSSYFIPRPKYKRDLKKNKFGLDLFQGL